MTTEAEIPQQCPAQVAAAEVVHANQGRMIDRLQKKNLIPIFDAVAYVINCDRHAEPSCHIELVHTRIDQLEPIAVGHVVKALEVVLAKLKARQA